MVASYAPFTYGLSRGIRDLAAQSGAPLVVIGIDNAFTVDRDVADNFIAPFLDLDSSLPLARIDFSRRKAVFSSWTSPYL